MNTNPIKFRVILTCFDGGEDTVSYKDMVNTPFDSVEEARVAIKKMATDELETLNSGAEGGEYFMQGPTLHCEMLVYHNSEKEPVTIYDIYIGGTDIRIAPLDAHMFNECPNCESIATASYCMEQWSVHGYWKCPHCGAKVIRRFKAIPASSRFDNFPV